MRFTDVIRMALVQLRVNPLRTLFTLLGIVVSVGFLVAVVAITGAAIVLSLIQLLAQVPGYEARLGTTIDEIRDLLAGFGIATDADAVASVISAIGAALGKIPALSTSKSKPN